MEPTYQSVDETNTLQESKLSNLLAGLALAGAGAVNANTNVDLLHGVDTRNGKNTEILFQQRMSHDNEVKDASRVKVDKYNTNKAMGTLVNDAAIEETVNKIRSTPAKYLSKYGKENAETIAKLALKYSAENDIDVDLLLAVMGKESAFNASTDTSAVGAVGIAQVMPSTVKDLYSRNKINDFATADGLKNIETNIKIAAEILSYFSQRQQNDIEMIFAEYNGGWGKQLDNGTYVGATGYRKVRQGEIPDTQMNAETVNYVKNCLMLYKYYKSI